MKLSFSRNQAQVKGDFVVRMGGVKFHVHATLAEVFAMMRLYFMSRRPA